MFTLSEYKLMKPNALFINTARGEIHNQDDLLYAIENEIIWGAGLDVTNPEPMQLDDQLLLHDRVVVTPHIGSASIETRRNMASLCAQNILLALDNKKVISSVLKKILYLNFRQKKSVSEKTLFLYYELVFRITLHND